RKERSIANSYMPRTNGGRMPHGQREEPNSQRLLEQELSRTIVANTSNTHDEMRHAPLQEVWQQAIVAHNVNSQNTTSNAASACVERAGNVGPASQLKAVKDHLGMPPRTQDDATRGWLSRHRTRHQQIA